MFTQLISFITINFNIMYTFYFCHVLIYLYKTLLSRTHFTFYLSLSPNLIHGFLFHTTLLCSSNVYPFSPLLLFVPCSHDVSSSVSFLDLRFIHSFRSSVFCHPISVSKPYPLCFKHCIVY